MSDDVRDVQTCVWLWESASRLLSRERAEMDVTLLLEAGEKYLSAFREYNTSHWEEEFKYSIRIPQVVCLHSDCVRIASTCVGKSEGQI
jgi:hypothetical protein